MVILYDHELRTPRSFKNTINALNKIILQLNNGILDKKLPIPWDDYRNCILLYNDDKLVEIKTKIHKVVLVSEWGMED